jgi:ribonuclease HI
MPEPRAGLKRGYYLLNTDGGMASNERRRSGDPLGRAAIGALLRTRRLATVAQISKAIGPATHNVAEYRALIEGLKLAHGHEIQHIRVYMDSELVVDQVNGKSAVRHANLSELHEVASSLAVRYKSFRISWVPREMNAEADQLVKDALDVDPTDDWRGRLLPATNPIRRDIPSVPETPPRR